MLLFFILLISAAIIMENVYRKTKNKKQTINNLNTIQYTNIYKAKRYITTKIEFELYKILIPICEKYNLIPLTQVVLYEIIEVNLNKYDKNYLKYFNKIASKSIDFVIIDKNTSRIRMCIELDDTTHNTPARIKRDKFLNTLFNEVDISPLIRIKPQKNYNIAEIEKLIIDNCTDIIYSKE